VPTGTAMLQTLRSVAQEDGIAARTSMQRLQALTSVSRSMVYCDDNSAGPGTITEGEPMSITSAASSLAMMYRHVWIDPPAFNPVRQTEPGVVKDSSNWYDSNLYASGGSPRQRHATKSDVWADAKSFVSSGRAASAASNTRPLSGPVEAAQATEEYTRPAASSSRAR
jgi:hypothetical protein